MKTKGIIISQEDYDRLTELEKNFDAKVEEIRANYRKGLENAIKGDLVKILWVKDKWYAELKGCDLSDKGIGLFIRREDADWVDSISSTESYNREKVNPCDNKTKSTYEKIISNYKKANRRLLIAFGIMFAAWLFMLLQYIYK